MKKIVSAVLLSWIVLTSCEQNTGVLSFDKVAFDRERAAWEASAITDYQFTQKSFFEASGPGLVRFTARENSDPVIEMLDEWIRENVPEEYWEFYHRGTTISAVYASIADAYAFAKDAVKNEGYTAIFDITYNTQYHYPEYVRYSIFHPEKIGEGGGGWEVKITEFVPLPPGE
ncbi:hypothetical protein AGMMS50267_01150 [Spirochaetia bacterium]|nr:hypothetical protein AGMMS50267_01150 [Spirochaetia bacterium]